VAPTGCSGKTCLAWRRGSRPPFRWTGLNCWDPMPLQCTRWQNGPKLERAAAQAPYQWLPEAA